MRLAVAGAEPRAVLRYETPDGWLEKAQVTLDNRVAATLNEKEMPELRIPQIRATFHTKSDAPTPEGGVETVIAIAGVEARKADETAPEVTKEQRKTLAALEKTAAELHFDRSGLVSRAKLDTPATMPPALRNIVDAMEQAVRLLVVPLPEEPVGVGAVWKHERHFPLGGVSLREVTTYELIAREGDEITLAFKTEAAGTPGPFHPPHLPAGSRAELLRFQGTGTGTARIHVKRLAPLELTAKRRSEMEMRVGPLNKQMTMNITTEADTALERIEPPSKPQEDTDKP